MPQLVGQHFLRTSIILGSNFLYIYISKKLHMTLEVEQHNLFGSVPLDNTKKEFSFTKVIIGLDLLKSSIFKIAERELTYAGAFST